MSSRRLGLQSEVQVHLSRIARLQMTKTTSLPNKTKTPEILKSFPVLLNNFVISNNGKMLVHYIGPYFVRSF